MNAREEILARVRAALPPHKSIAEEAHAGAGRLYARAGRLSATECEELLLDRLRDYDASLVEVAEERQIATAIVQTLAACGETHFVVAPEFPEAWLPADAVRDNALSVAEMEAMQAAVTTCELAVASTGTIFIVHGGAQGRRLLTLLPDHHICVLRRRQIVETVPEAFLSEALRSRAPVTTISGPSATSDIEMTRIRGVHGPRRLTVILVS